MSDHVFAPGGSDVGTSRERPLRPQLTFRCLMLAPLAYFTWATARVVRDVADGGGVENPVGSVLAVVVFLVLLYAVARLWSSRVWVEHSFEPGSTMIHQYTIDKVELGRHTRGYLRSPHLLRINGVQPFGGRPSWRLSVFAPDGRRLLTTSAWWTPDLDRLLTILQAVAVGDPQLLADDQTRELVLGSTRGRRRGRAD